jgi:GT2 family glycosyltransferase
MALARGLVKAHRIWRVSALGKGALTVKVCILIATAGRAALLPRVAQHWLAQTRPADAIVVSAANPSDVEGLQAAFPTIEVVFGPKGLPAQRNTALRAVEGRCDVASFFDDDLIPSAHYVARLAELFSAHPAVMGVSGVLADDGVTRGGIGFEEAVAKVAEADAALPPLSSPMHDISHMYGCNMAARMPQALAVGFDERLPLYAWQEDRDFSKRLAAHGRIVRTPALTGVHMGSTSGRSPGKRLGYAQVANPWYFLNKGTMKPMEAASLVGRNMAANLAKSAFPEPWVDRFGRLRGNFAALGDILAGRCQPERMLDH